MATIFERMQATAKKAHDEYSRLAIAGEYYKANKAFSAGMRAMIDEVGDDLKKMEAEIDGIREAGLTAQTQVKQSTLDLHASESRRLELKRELDVEIKRGDAKDAEIASLKLMLGDAKKLGRPSPDPEPSK
jgi:uncharacterized protein YaaN involved in tellurite resistance